MSYERASVSERLTMPPAIAVSAVGFAIEPPEGALIGETGDLHRPSASDTTLWIPLVRRTREPFSGVWALPGGPTEWDETLADTALRALTGAVLREPGYLEQLYAFGAVERSAQAQRLVTIAYWAQYGERELSAAPIHTAASSAPEADPNVAWFSADRLPELAFDHAEIVEYALWRLRVKTEYSSVAHRFLGPEFTLAQLRRVHEAILGQAVDPANFRRQSIASGHLVDTGDVLTGSAHRPARLYRFRGEPPVSPGQSDVSPHTTNASQGSSQ
ncbi:MAG: NUDIX hydrolase [Leucobacter sp.]